jgi:general stress protein YciG
VHEVLTSTELMRSIPGMGKTTMRTCRHCGELFEYPGQGSKSCASVKAPGGWCEPKPRGFAAMDPARVSEIGKMGGKLAHEMGRAHRFTTEEAKVAGKIGGNAPHKSRGPQKATG